MDDLSGRARSSIVYKFDEVRKFDVRELVFGILVWRQMQLKA